MSRFISLLCTALVCIAPISSSAAPDSTPSDTRTASTEEPRYWITASSGKTHNRSCRYYKKSKGHGSDTPSGNNCKICGGADRG